MDSEQASLLLFDIGNTTIKVGLASERAVLTSYTLRTDAGQTSDDLGLKLLALFPFVKPGKHVKFSEVSFINCERLKLEFKGSLTLNLDGNLKSFKNPVEFEIIKNSVNFII